MEFYFIFVYMVGIVHKYKSHLIKNVVNFYKTLQLYQIDIYFLTYICAMHIYIHFHTYVVSIPDWFIAFSFSAEMNGFIRPRRHVIYDEPARMSGGSHIKSESRLHTIHNRHAILHATQLPYILTCRYHTIHTIFQSR